MSGLLSRLGIDEGASVVRAGILEMGLGNARVTDENASPKRK